MVVQHIVQYGCKLEGSIREVQNFEATLFVDVSANQFHIITTYIYLLVHFLSLLLACERVELLRTEIKYVFDILGGGGGHISESFLWFLI